MSSDDGAAGIAIAALQHIVREHDACTEALRKDVGTTECAAFIQSARHETIACEALSRLGVLTHEAALDRMTRTAAAMSSAITILRDDADEARRSDDLDDKTTGQPATGV